jgi:hypothetical protein
MQIAAKQQMQKDRVCNPWIPNPGLFPNPEIPGLPLLLVGKMVIPGSEIPGSPPFSQSPNPGIGKLARNCNPYRRMINWNYTNLLRN